MPAISLTALPDVHDRWSHIPAGVYAGCQLGDYEVAHVRVPGPLDCTEHYREVGLPGGVCNCPHYGYVFEGHMRCTYPGTGKPDEVAKAGDIYYWPAGHVLVYESATVCFELNPAAAFHEYIEYGIRAAARDEGQRT